MINLDQLTIHINKILDDLDFYSNGKFSNRKNVLCLLLMIASHETHRGTYIRQQGGPALGIYQIEEIVIKNVILYLTQRRPEYIKIVNDSILGKDNLIGLNDLFNENRVIEDLRTSTVLARMQLWTKTEKIPSLDDGVGLGKYCKKHWNTSEGKATAEDYYKYYNDCKEAIDRLI